MQRFKDILYVVVPELDGQDALERAVYLAENNQARLTVVEVIDEIPPNTKLLDRILFPEFKAKMILEHQKGLEKLVAPWNRNVELQTKVLIGTPFLEIIREVLHNGHDLVIKTSESNELLDRVFGCDDMHLLRKCPCPVWLVKPDSPKVYQRILAAVDVGDYYPPEELNKRHLLNIQILEMASSLALSGYSELHIVHAWEAIDESAMRSAFVDTPKEEIIAYVEDERQQHRKNLYALMDQTISKLGKNVLEYLNPQTHLLTGSPRKEIPVFANENKINLVVMGTVARTGISGLFMGNTAETILNKLDCSVLAIKPLGFETPVAIEN